MAKLDEVDIPDDCVIKKRIGKRKKSESDSESGKTGLSNKGARGSSESSRDSSREAEPRLSPKLVKCSTPGCHKKFKNIEAAKYHATHSHQNLKQSLQKEENNDNSDKTSSSQNTNNSRSDNEKKNYTNTSDSGSNHKSASRPSSAYSDTSEELEATMPHFGLVNYNNHIDSNKGSKPESSYNILKDGTTNVVDAKSGREKVGQDPGNSIRQSGRDYYQDSGQRRAKGAEQPGSPQAKAAAPSVTAISKSSNGKQSLPNTPQKYSSAKLTSKYV